MIKDKLEVFEAIQESLGDYDIKSEADLSDAIFEICDGMVDIYYSDLFESIEYLWYEGLLDEVEGDLMSAVTSAQYYFYEQVAQDNMQELLNMFKIEEEQE